MARKNLLSLLLEPAAGGVYKPPAVPSGAAHGAHYPAGTRGDIQAVTFNIKFELDETCDLTRH